MELRTSRYGISPNLRRSAGGPEATLFFSFGAPIVEQDTTLVIHRRVEWKRSAGALPSGWEGGSWVVFPRLGFAMPVGLKRIYGQRHLHFITFSCYRRLPLLKTVRAAGGPDATLLKRGLVKRPKDWPLSSWLFY